MIEEMIKKLERERFTDVRVCPMPPPVTEGEAAPEHTHDEYTVHSILDGVLTITDMSGTHTYGPGDRVEFPAGTTHCASGSTENGRMIIGVKKN
jgi:quercetin dioxygenase-like cupin family protein